MKRPIVALVFVGVLAVGGLALAGGLKGKTKAEGAGKDPLGLPTGADKNLPVQGVGVATGYAQSQLIDTGAVNYDYINPTSWAYVVTGKDWGNA